MCRKDEIKGKKKYYFTYIILCDFWKLNFSFELSRCEQVKGHVTFPHYCSNQAFYLKNIHYCSSRNKYRKKHVSCVCASCSLPRYGKIIVILAKSDFIIYCVTCLADFLPEKSIDS